MKKKVLIIIFTALCFNLHAKEFEFSKLEENLPDLMCFETLDYNSNKNDELLAYQKASEENKYVLRFQKYSCDFFFKEGEYADKESMLMPKFGPFWYTETIKDNHTVLYSKYALNHGFYEDDSFFYEIQFFNYQPHLRACPIGYYLVEICFKDFVYSFKIEDPRFQTMDKKYEQMFLSLQDYVELRTIDAGSDFDYLGESLTTYCWKNKEFQYRFYDDMVNKKSTLPQYVIDFQQTYEKVLSNILENFRKLASPTVTTNLRIRQTPKNGNPIVTIQQGAKVQILETGEADKIDGIEGNWVKVKVPATSKDKDGNLLGKEITGWCFDGYLE